VGCLTSKPCCTCMCTCYAYAHTHLAPCMHAILYSPCLHTSAALLLVGLYDSCCAP
jgi:hypothetical protein